MGEAYSTYGGERSPYKVLVGKPERKDHFVHPDVDWKMILRWILGSGMGGMDLIDLAEDRERWRALVNAVMNFRVPSNAGNFLTSWEPVCFSRRTVLNGVSK
jgi:hypothetical protein